MIKLQTPLHVFFCEFCETKNIYFVEKLRKAASKHRIYIFFFVLILLRQNRYLPLNSDHLLGKQRTMLRYRSQPSKMSYLRFGGVLFFTPENVEEDSGNIPGNVSKDSRNVQEDSRECSIGVQGMFKKSQGNVQEDCREYARGFRGILKKIPGLFKKIPGSLNLDLF